MARYIMQARSSSNGQLYTWLSPSRAFNGSGFPGPGSAQHVVVAKRVSDTVNLNIVHDQTITVAPTSATIEYHNCIISVDINVATKAKFRDCVFAAGVDVTAPTIDVDNASLRSLVFGGGAITGTVTGYAGQIFEWGALTATDTQFMLPGVRAANANTVVSEDASKKTTPRAGVWLNFLGFASTNPVLTFRKNGAYGGLALNPNNSIVTNTTTFVPVAAGQSVGWQLSGGSTNVLIVAEFV